MNPITITYSGLTAEWTGMAITIYDDHGVSAFLPCQSLPEALQLMNRDDHGQELILPN